MKHLLMSLSLMVLLLPIVGQARDNIVKNAQIDIARFEKQASGLTAARRSNAKRILKLLELSQARLENSTHKDDASWQAVNQRFQDLRTQLERLIAGKPVATQNQALSKEEKTETSSKQVAARQKQAVAPLVSGQRVRVKKLARDIKSVSDSILTTGPSTLQDRNKISAYQKKMKQFATALGRYPQRDDPDVQQARKAYLGLRKKLTDEFKRAKSQLAELGNVQQRLASLEANIRQYTVPKKLTIPFTKNQAATWVKAASSARTVAEHSLKELAKIAPIAYLPNNPGTPQTGAPYDANDVKRLTNNAQSNLKKLTRTYQAMSDELDNRLKQTENDVLSRYQENPNSDKRWIFLGKGRKSEALSLFDESKKIAQSSIVLESLLGRKADHAQAILDKLIKSEQQFLNNYQIALESSRLPEAKSMNKKMLKIAQEVIEKPRYKFGKHGKIVLTTDTIVERERKDSEIKIDNAEITLGGDLKMKGTETIWNYKWQEFKFAVPLKDAESDTWHIWWITAKNFSSGGPRTPLNEWVSGKATQGNPILEKNL